MAIRVTPQNGFWEERVDWGSESTIEERAGEAATIKTVQVIGISYAGTEEVDARPEHITSPERAQLPA